MAVKKTASARKTNTSTSKKTTGKKTVAKKTPAKKPSEKKTVKKNAEKKTVGKDDGTTVKIKVVAGTKNKENKETNTESVLESAFKRMDEAFSRMDETFEKVFGSFDTQTPDTFATFANYVGEKKPSIIKINGLRYYSEEDVAKRVAGTIETCAKVAAQEKARESEVQESVSSKNSTSPDKEYCSKPEPNDCQTPAKVACIAAKVIMYTFVGLIIATSSFGIYHIITALCK